MSSVNFTLTGDIIDEEITVSIQLTECKRILLQQYLTTGLEFLRKQDSLLYATASENVEHNQQIEVEVSEGMIKGILSSFCETVDSWKPVLDGVSDELTIKTITEMEEAENNSDTLSEAEATIKTHLAAQITEAQTLELKAEDIGEDTALDNTRVGRILWRWSENEDAPFAVSPVGKDGGVNIWEIENRG